MTSAALLLAAGASTRMGRPKPLLAWGGVPLVAYQVRELRAAGVERVVVVLGHDADGVRPHVPSDAHIVLNEAYREGRASSLRVGAAALPDEADPVIVLNVDQPRPRTLLRQLIGAHDRARALVTVPAFESRRGHPPVLAGALLPELRAASEAAQGLRGIIAAHAQEVHEVSVTTDIVLLDLNTPEEYERALRQYRPLSA